jgi:hypothetical protein
MNPNSLHQRNKVKYWYGCVGKWGPKWPIKKPTRLDKETKSYTCGFGFGGTIFQCKLCKWVENPIVRYRRWNVATLDTWSARKITGDGTSMIVVTPNATRTIYIILYAHIIFRYIYSSQNKLVINLQTAGKYWGVEWAAWNSEDEWPSEYTGRVLFWFVTPKIFPQLSSSEAINSYWWCLMMFNDV